jgi:hypothetical protein
MALQTALELRAPRKPQQAPSSFSKIDRRLRKLLDRFQGTEQLQQLDDMISGFVSQVENTKRVVFIDDGLIRIVRILNQMILTILVIIRNLQLLSCSLFGC